jgi:hypothetical protein
VWKTPQFYLELLYLLLIAMEDIYWPYFMDITTSLCDFTEKEFLENEITYVKSSSISLECFQNSGAVMHFNIGS